jgi:hypothetical protein
MEIEGAYAVPVPDATPALAVWSCVRETVAAYDVPVPLARPAGGATFAFPWRS